MLEKGGKEREEAKTLAEKFEGFGPTLWLNTYQFYRDWFGANGCAIHALLVEASRKKGAVPSAVLIPHYQKKDEGEKGKE